ncbi:low affinity immunoglobulin gamma Fc region receptor II-b-like [Centropristis striata]|uniref:low affinity immunoglobulin gamma Fc region receptor II-b-like n=1 Tax=Centropristis striata TaxID=184440 RepID=UPI0027E1E323|nr:low affinity immunoglobulin gamma Fc region receptor II-b-like [Centropristis striata]
MFEFIQLNSYTQKSDAVFLRITPNRLQHFQYDTVSFDCVESDASTKLRALKKTEKKCVPECVIKTYAGSSSTIKRVYQSDSGEYWCETGGGERSSRVNITVAAGSVILESPVLPVKEGINVTLSCRKKASSSNLPADFYKDGLLISSSTGEFTIWAVSKSDEGLYKCSSSDGGESAESWLAVRGETLHLVFTIVMVALLLLLVGLLHCGKLTVTQK